MSVLLFIALVVVCCVVASISAQQITSTPASLYDLSTDEYEKYDLSDDPTYADDLTAFRARAVELAAKYYVEPIYADYAALSDYWDVSGGVGPWLESTTEPLAIEQRYNNGSSSITTPPHIVFVLVDDWGWNDLGARSTYLSWATPNIDNLMKESISLENYYTNELCTPSRGSLLTGKYAWRLGFEAITTEKGTHAELSLDEVTLAQELKTAGYQTYIVGKWDMGMSTLTHLPLQRGFDYFYGFLSGFEDYYWKTFGTNQDLRENNDLVSNADELHPDLHSAYLFETKAENVIANHAANYPDSPMFLYYAMQLIHSPYEVPDVYRNRCEQVTSDMNDDEASLYQTYCGMVLMMDEAIANLTCAISSNGFADNTVLIIASDNGGIDLVPSASYPWRGSKGSHAKGGVLATAIVHSQLIDEKMRGKVYKGLMHVTDWLPTLMGLATNGQWSGSYLNSDSAEEDDLNVLDGYDMWTALTTHTASPREEIVHFIGDADANLAVITTSKLKYVYGEVLPGASSVEYVFSEGDQDKKSSSISCDSPYLTTVDSPRLSKLFLRTASLIGVDLANSSDSDVETKFVFKFAAIVSVLVLCVMTMVAFVCVRPGSSKDRYGYSTISDAQTFEGFDYE